MLSNMCFVYEYLILMVDYFMIVGICGVRYRFVWVFIVVIFYK